MGKQTFIVGAICTAGLLCALAEAGAESGAPYRAWGRETLDRIETSFRMPGSDLYADEIRPGQPAAGQPAFTWGGGVLLSAFASAARIDPDHYAPLLRRNADALQGYWQEHDGIGGYDVLPVPKPPDRYYDDNAWIVLALADAFEATHDRGYLEQAEKTFRFVMSGEDEKLGGGIYWKEPEKISKNTCSNAPAIVAALRLHRLTRQQEYRAIALRLYAWVNANLQDADGLYWDNIRLDGSVEKTKWSYNSALMIRANVLLHALTRQAKYREEARRIARAAEARWAQPKTGAIADDAAFAHLLAEAFLYLHAMDHDARWRRVTERALDYLHKKGRDANGFYGPRWENAPAAPLPKARLIDQASAARAFWEAARAISPADTPAGTKAPNVWE